jgi:hypothetical protein
MFSTFRKDDQAEAVRILESKELEVGPVECERSICDSLIVIGFEKDDSIPRKGRDVRQPERL